MAVVVPSPEPRRARLNVWAILVGTLVDFGSTFLVAGLVVAARQDDAVVPLLLLFLGLAMTALGGYVAAAMAGRRSLAHGLAVGILSTAGALILERVGGASAVEVPDWYRPVAYGLTIPAAVLGAWLRRRFWGERAEAADHPSGAYPTLRQAIWLLLLSLLITGVVTVAAGLVVSLALRDGPRFARWGVAAVVAGAAAGYGLVLIWAVHKARAPAREILPMGRVRLASTWPAIVTVIGAAILFSEMANLFRRAFSVPRIPLDPTTLFGGVESMLWAAAFFIVVLAPIAEELLFRGVILRGFLTHYTVRKAIVVSAVLFGIFHVNPLQLPTALVLGVLFAWWRTKTGSLLLPLMGHALNNALALAVPRLPWAGVIGHAAAASGRTFQPLWLDLAGIALFIVGVLRFRHVTRSQSPAGA